MSFASATQSSIVDAFDWHERDDVDSAHPRMFARMRSQIDQADRGVEQREHGGFERTGIAGHGDDRAVMGRIGGEIQQARTGHTSNGRRDCGNDFGAASLADVRDAFDDRHGTMVAAFARWFRETSANSLTDRDFCPIIAPAYSRHPID